MIIAVNARHLLPGLLEGCGYFTQETFRCLANQHPGHQFHFLLDRPHASPTAYPGNVHFHVIVPPVRHSLLRRLWFDLRLPAVLRRLKADLFVSTDGFASLGTRVPQCLVIHDLGFLHHPEAYLKNQARYLRRRTPHFIKKARRIATVSAFLRNDIIRQYGAPSEKIDVVYTGIKDIFRPVDPALQGAVRAQWTEGRDYFIYAGGLYPPKNLVNLLHAFTLFKKRQQSNMKLVLAGHLAWKNDEFRQKLKTYKHRADVVLTGCLDEEELARLVGSAYALVYPSLFEDFGVPVLEAMSCGVPVLTSRDSSMQELAGSAGLYFDPADHGDMAEAMMRIYKDENLRSRMIAEGLQQAAPFSWERTAGLLWASMMKAAGSV